MRELLPVPFIPLLGNEDVLDLEQLGDELVTYIRYGTDEEMSPNDQILPSWRGRSVLGEVLDFADTWIRIDPDLFDPVHGFPVKLLKQFVLAQDQGEAFYSYFLRRNNSPIITDESKRIFFQVGRRPAAASRLPVAQVKEAHDGAIDPAPPVTTYTVAVVPYEAMAEGDRVTLNWQGYYYDGSSATTYTNTKPLTANDVGKVLTWPLQSGYVSAIEGGHAVLEYTVKYAASAQETASQQQTLLIQAPASAELEPVTVEGHSGPALDPAQFPNGIVLQIEPYPGMQVGDDVLLYWTGSRADRSVSRAVRVDQSIVDSGRLQFHLEAHWLALNNGANVSVRYQYARLGASGSSQVATFAVRAPLQLPRPSVERAVPGANGGTLQARLVTSGVKVMVPEEANYGPDDQVSVIWAGQGSGYHEATEPTQPGGRTFAIPATAVPATMGKNLNVYYTVTEPDMPPQRSELYDLRVIALAPTDVMQIACTEAAHTPGQLSLANAPSGAEFQQGRWPFSAEGQWITVYVRGVDDDLEAIHHALFENHPITQQEASAGVVEVLPRAFLEQLKLDEQFTVSVSVSFDQGTSSISFQSLPLRLVR